ncbi:hypothetical protein K493DRAFT_191126, partial [Basidiobolus meristosporus CBS 931.73]
KVIFIDKPLLKKSVTPRSRNQQFFNAAFKSMFVKTNGINSIAEKPHKSNLTNPENMDDTTYTLWTFGSFTVLIRCKIHGFIKSNGPENKSKLVGIKTKMEYHLDHGFEDVVAEEKARWWIHTFIRGDASLMVGRIDALSGRLVKVERRNMVDIIPNGNWPRPHSKLLHYLFT